MQPFGCLGGPPPIFWEQISWIVRFTPLLLRKIFIRLDLTCKYLSAKDLHAVKNVHDQDAPFSFIVRYARVIACKTSATIFRFESDL